MAARKLHILPKLPETFLHQDMGRFMPQIDAMLRQRGREILLTPYLICPCVDPPSSGGTGVPVPDCPTCNGSGIAFNEEASSTVLGLVFGTQTEQSQGQTGIMTTGTVNITFPSDIIVSEGDRVKLLDAPQEHRLLRKYNKATKGIRVPMDIQSVVGIAIREDGGGIRMLKAGQEYYFHDDRNLITFPDEGPVQHGTVFSLDAIVLPWYIIESVPSVGRSIRTSYFSEDGTEMQSFRLPTTCRAVRADIYFGRFEKEVSHAGDATR